VPIVWATAFRVSIMKSRDSVAVKLSMQAWRKVCSSSPRLAEMKGLGQHHGVLDQVGHVEHQAAAAGLAVQDGQSRAAGRAPR
jgi:hypothetical protein